MRKTISMLIALLMILTLTACITVKSETVTADSDAPVRIAGMKGPTSMGLVKLMEDNEKKNTLNTYVFTMAGSADEITPKLVKGELDMAALPVNLASVLYNNTEGAIRILAVNTLGVLYILEKGDSVGSVADLKGKTIYATGKGSVPEYSLRYVLSQNGIDPDKDVTIEFKSEPAEVVSILSSADSGIAMLPQPYVTVAQGKVDGLHVVLDITKAWDDLDNGSRLITGVFAVRDDFLKNEPEKVSKFLQEYSASVEWVLGHTEEAADLIEKYDIVKAAVAVKALPLCNIVFLSGEEMKTPVEGYLATLFEQNPKSVGGSLPDDNFYYMG